MCRYAPPQSDPTTVADGWRRFNPVHRMRLGWIASTNIKDRSPSDTALTLTSASLPAGRVTASSVVVHRIVNSVDGWWVA